MHIKKSIQGDDGEFTIEGEYTPDEVDVILEVGLNQLYKQGALPFSMVDKKELARYIEENSKSKS